jgi:hypothetical protein
MFKSEVLPHDTSRFPDTVHNKISPKSRYGLTVAQHSESPVFTGLLYRSLFSNILSASSFHVTRLTGRVSNKEPTFDISRVFEYDITAHVLQTAVHYNVRNSPFDFILLLDVYSFPSRSSLVSAVGGLDLSLSGKIGMRAVG